MSDLYFVGINFIWSVCWDMFVNEIFGNSGCDNCCGSFMDVVDCMDDMLIYCCWVGGVYICKFIWVVFQNFGNESYWL